MQTLDSPARSVTNHDFAEHSPASVVLPRRLRLGEGENAVDDWVQRVAIDGAKERFHIAPASDADAAKRDLVHEPAHEVDTGTPAASAPTREISPPHAAALIDWASDTPLDYLTRWRMYRAKVLLRGSELSLMEIAGRVGYETDTALSRAFRRFEGVAPGEWRRSGRPKLVASRRNAAPSNRGVASLRST
jgi:AraC-like DNA-binding protein